MIIAGELMLDAESREELIFMIKTVESDTDFLAWVDYLRLPSNGWEGTGEPPQVELSGSDSVAFVNSKLGNTLLPNAYAASATKLTVRQARVLLLTLRKVGGSAKNRREVIDGIKATTQALKNTDLTQLRKTVFSGQTVVAGAKLGKNGLSKLYRKSRNLRISPFALASIISYLESRTDCDPEDQFCKNLDPNVARKLDSEFYRKIITDALKWSNTFGHRIKRQCKSINEVSS